MHFLRGGQILGINWGISFIDLHKLPGGNVLDFVRLRVLFVCCRLESSFDRLNRMRWLRSRQVRFINRRFGLCFVRSGNLCDCDRTGQLHLLCGGQIFVNHGLVRFVDMR